MNNVLDLGWLILALPFLSFLIIVAFTRPNKQLSALVTIAGVGGAFLLSVLSFFAVNSGGRVDTHFTWFTVGETQFQLGLLIDPLTAMMLIVVTTVSLLVQIYSTGYMHGDPGYSRYYAWMALFTTSMLGLVLAPNFLQLYIFWELVGLCSYLLIGFWFHKPEAAAAAKKAFVTTRLGDLGLLIGILILFWNTGTFSFEGITEAVEAKTLAGGLLATAAVLVFCGAVGKSAQFPLHVWLPDAMEGPTPVSALIHAATMVAAGVYLVARAFEIFHASPEATIVVAIIGGITAFVAASMGLVMTDIKRVMAYSTVSQLGYMMLGLGVAATIVPGMSHLTNHAFFKALLFLGAGSVIHATGSQDMDEFSGLGSKMKVTAITIGLASLSLAGIPPLSGFWSKDEILVEALHNGNPLMVALGVLAVIVAGMTAFYVARMYIRTFLGPFRLAAPAGGHGAHGSATHAASTGQDAHSDASRHAAPAEAPTVHESPWVMTLPLAILAVPAVFSGFLGSPLAGYFYQHFLEGEEFHAPVFDAGIATVSSLIALAGIGLAFATYYFKWISAPAIQRRFSGVHALLINKYYLDDLYLWLIRNVMLGLFNLFQWFDLHVIDTIVNGVGRTLAGTGAALREAQTGRVQNYGLAFFGGVILVVVFTVFLR
ncbi:MAG: NADH-quinone oxidoreductase subunit L [Chloroflexota bacterium]